MNTTKINDILKYVIYGAIFLVPFIPLIVPNFLFFPFVTGKAYVFRIIVELMVGAWAVLALRNPEYRPKKSWITILATVFIVIVALADIFGANPLKSIWSNYERMEGLVLMIHLLGFLFVTSSVLNTEKLWHKFFHTSIVASVLMSFYGLLQLAGKLTIHQGGVRLDATFGNSAYLAVYMLFHIFLTLFLLFRRRGNSVISWLYGLAIFLQTIILYNTATRGSILGLIAGLFVTGLVVAIFEKENKTIRKICVGSLVGLVLLVGLFFGLKNTSFVQESPVLSRFASISLQESTTKSRFMVWNIAWEGFKEKPILGWGQENFNYVFNKYYDPGLYNQEQWFDRTHNVFFDWLIAGGLLGLLGYFSLFWALLYYLIKDKNNNFSVTEKAIFIGMLIAYFIHNLFVFDNLISYILFFSLLGYIHSLNVDFDTKESVVDEKINKIAIPAVVLVAVFSIHFFNTESLLVNVNLIEALKQQEGGVTKNIEYYKQALSYDSPTNQEVCEQLVQFGVKSVSVEIDQNTKQEIFTLAETEMSKQIEKDPENVRLEFMLSTFLANAGLYEDSLKHLERSLELSPTKQSIMIVLANVYINMGDYEKALIYLKKAYDLDPSFGDVALMYAVGAVYSGDMKLAEDLLVPNYGSTLVYDQNLINAYITTKQYDKIIEIFENHIKNNPNDFQARLSLAATYLEAGYRTKSISIIQEMIEINPDFKGQGEYYISEIKAGRNP